MTCLTVQNPQILSLNNRRIRKSANIRVLKVIIWCIVSFVLNYYLILFNPFRFLKSVSWFLGAVMSEPKTPTPTPAGDTYKGWVFKWTNYIKGYQRRWFVLSNGLLSYYRYASLQNGSNPWSSHLAAIFIYNYWCRRQTRLIMIWSLTESSFL